jgi:type IV pilus assembly protein PilW
MAPSIIVLSHRSRGFSMVELLVGVAIALIGMVLMFQAMERWEGRKRTTSSGSDAQVAGSIAVFGVERDLRMAGHGIGSATAELGCSVAGFDSQAAAGAGAAIPAFLMLPVQIAHGASGAADTLTVLYGDGTTISTEMPFTASTNTTKTANNADGLKPGDVFIAATTGGGNCGLFETTTNPPGLGATIGHATGAYTNYQGVSVTARYNAGGGNGIPIGATAGRIYNLGTAPRANLWQVNGGQLVVSNLLTGEAASPVADGIVNFQAQYGFDEDNDGFIAPTVNAGGDPEWVDTIDATPTAAQWQRVRAVRFALLARSPQYEPTSVTTVNPSWAGGNFTMTNLDGSLGTTNPDTPDNWRRYRYRVYETVVFFRNVAWGAS